MKARWQTHYATMTGWANKTDQRNKDEPSLLGFGILG